MKITAGIAAALSVVLAGVRVRAQVPDPARSFIEQAEARAVEAAKRGDFSPMSAMYADPSAGRTAGQRWKEAGSPGFEIGTVDVRGDLAVESGRVGGADYISVWTRQPDGAWKISRDVWGQAPRALPGAAIPASSSPRAVAPPAEDFVPIPDPRSLSDGFVRGIQDDLKSTAARLRALERGDPARLRKAAEKADRSLQKTIRDVGWIDVGRFGVDAACSAAYIVARSGDLALLRSTLPLMEKDLQHAGNDPGCYGKAKEAYLALGGR